MGLLWDVIQAHIDHSVYRPSERQVAGKLGIAPNALSNWKHLRRLPTPVNLHKVAELTGTPYRVVLDAALKDTGYLPKDVTGYAAPMKSRISMVSEQGRSEVDLEGGPLPSVDPHETPPEGESHRTR